MPRHGPTNTASPCFRWSLTLPRIIEAAPPGPGHYQFGHALIQEAIYEDISPVRRAREHGRTAETIERLHRLDLDDHAAALAHHFTRAGGIDSTQKVARYSLITGEHALKVYAQEEALGHFQRGLMTKGVDVEGVAPAPDAEAAALMWHSQHLDVPVVTLTRAFDFYVEANDVAHAIGVAEYPIQSFPGNRVSVELVAQALQLLPPDAPEGGRLLSRYAFVMGMEEGDYRSATEAFDGALAIARRTGDVALELRTLAQSSMVDYWHLRLDETVAKGLRVIELARRAADQLSEVSARFWVGQAMLRIGESEGAQPHAAAMLSTAERLRDRYWLTTAI